MHKGLAYPYLFEFWQCELFFWPGLVPRKVHVSCPLGYGTSWDRLNPGLVTDVGVADAFLTGDPRWIYSDPGGVFIVTVLFHKTATHPKRYSGSVRVEEVGPSVASLASGELVGPQYVFAGPLMTLVTTSPPYSLGLVPPVVIRPATWSEI